MITDIPLSVKNLTKSVEKLLQFVKIKYGLENGKFECPYFQAVQDAFDDQLKENNSNIKEKLIGDLRYFAGSGEYLTINQVEMIFDAADMLEQSNA